MNTGMGKEYQTRAMTVCGLVAGPLFILAVIVQAVTRSGFNLVSQPVSLLSLGPGGWIQIANFLVSGVLTITFAVGIRRELHPGRGGSWGPWFVGAFGFGLVVAGLFPPDAALGFPPGAPVGVPASMSYHSVLHGFAFTLSFGALTAACIVFVRRDAGLKRWGGVVYTGTTAVAAITLSQWPGLSGIGLRDFLAAVIA